jgi:hypothetical protein
MTKHRKESPTQPIPRLRLVALVLLFALALLPASVRAQTWTWHTEDVDTQGKFTSITTDKDSNLHLSYSDGQAIKYAFRPSGANAKWFNMIIDGGDTYTNITTDAQGHPHICYTARVLRYAQHDGSQWKIQTIATDNAPIYFSCAIAISPDGSPHISWYREKNADNTPYAHIKYAELQNGAWVIRTLDFEMQTGKFESMTLDAKGNPILSFDAYVKGLLKFAHKDGDNWKVETVDFRGHTNNVYDVGMGNFIAIDHDGKPVISYQDGENIKFAHLVDDKWKVETIDSYRPSGGWVGFRTAVAVDRSNHPHVIYDAGGPLKHAYFDGQKWHIQVLARGGGMIASRYCSMTIDKDDTLYVSYSDPDDGSLKVAVGELKTAAPVSSASETKP